MLAVRNGGLEVSQLLLEAGANPLLHNTSHQSALDIAKQLGNQALVELLEQQQTSRSLWKLF